MTWIPRPDYKPLPIPPQIDEKFDEKTEQEAFVEISKTFLNGIHNVLDTTSEARRSAAETYGFCHENYKVSHRITEQSRADLQEIEVTLVAKKRILIQLEVWRRQQISRIRSGTAPEHLKLMPNVNELLPEQIKIAEDESKNKNDDTGSDTESCESFYNGLNEYEQRQDYYRKKIQGDIDKLQADDDALSSIHGNGRKMVDIKKANNILLNDEMLLDTSNDAMHAYYSVFEGWNGRDIKATVQCMNDNLVFLCHVELDHQNWCIKFHLHDITKCKFYYNPKKAAHCHHAKWQKPCKINFHEKTKVRGTMAWLISKNMKPSKWKLINVRPRNGANVVAYIQCNVCLKQMAKDQKIKPATHSISDMD